MTGYIFPAMPIYEYYCPRNHTVYQFYARTLAQGKLTPRCPDNPAWPLQRIVSQFAFTGRAREEPAAEDQPAAPGGPEDARLEAAMAAMEKDFDSVDENDPRAMARMMRRMSELSGEKIDGEMEEIVRKLEEGADPESLEERFGTDADGAEDGGGGPESGPKTEAETREARMRHRLRRATTAPRRDPKLYDYE